MRDLLIVDPAFRRRFEELALTSAAAVLRFLGGDAIVGNNTVVAPATIRFRDGSLEKVFFKQYIFPAPAWAFIGRRSKARREFENYAAFQRMDIPCAQALACGELRDGLGRLQRAFILTRAVPEAQTLIEFVQARCPSRAHAASRKLRQEIIARLAPLVARIHQRNFFHNDLVWRNLLVTCPPQGTPSLWWIDCPRGRFSFFGRRRLQLKDLASLDKQASRRLSRAERLAFVKAYLGKRRLDADVKRMAGGILAFKRRRWSDEDGAGSREGQEGRSAGVQRGKGAGESSPLSPPLPFSSAPFLPRSRVVVVAKHQTPLDKLGLSTLAGVKAFRGDLIKDHKGRRDIFCIKTSTDDGRPLVLFLKRSWKPYKKDGIASVLRRGRVWSISRREWENSQLLAAAGLKTAGLVAYGEDCGPLWERFSFILTEAAAGAQTVEQFLRDCRDRGGRRRVFDALARHIRRMHDAGLATPDLFTRHLFVDDGAEPPQFCLIDMARLDRGQPLPARLRARDLAALNITAPLRFVTARERIRFLRVYAGRTDKPLAGRIRRRVQHLLQRRKFRRFHEEAAPAGI